MLSPFTSLRPPTSVPSNPRRHLTLSTTASVTSPLYSSSAFPPPLNSYVPLLIQPPLHPSSSFISSVDYPAPALPESKPLSKYTSPPFWLPLPAMSANMNPSLLPGINDLLPNTEMLHAPTPPTHTPSSHHRSDSCYKLFHAHRGASHPFKTNGSHFASSGRAQPKSLNTPLPSVNELLKSLHNTTPQSSCSSGSRSKSPRRSTATSALKSKKITYPCPRCSRTFTRKSDAGKHQRVVHDKLIDSKCFVCQRQFTRKDYCAVRHHFIHHDFVIHCLTASNVYSLLLFSAQIVQKHLKSVHGLVVHPSLYEIRPPQHPRKDKRQQG